MAAEKKPVAKTVTKKASEVKSVEALQTELAAKQQDLYDAKRSHQAGELVNPRVLGTTRKEIARIHTAIRVAVNNAQKESK